MEKDFLIKKYPDLPKSPEVKKAVQRQELRTGEKIKNLDQYIETYLARLKEIFEPSNSSKRERRISILKEKLYQLFVIKPEEVPETHFSLQQRIAREQGYGQIEISDKMKREIIETIIKDQKQSLEAWVDYLGSPGLPYPAWFKYFVFRNIVKLGPYDKEKKEFRTRSRGTTSLFPDINREALAYVFDQLEKTYFKKEKIEDPELQALLERANFSHLYAYAIERITPASQEQKEIIKGLWKKYAQGSDPKPLYASLQGQGTNWCTAGEAVAKSQLELGDFYVYYTANKKGKNTVPRIAIRMQAGQIAEIRGIDRDQNLEPKLLEIAKVKMAALPGAEKYEKQSADMKALKEIEKKVSHKEKLTKEELCFLHEIKGEIDGFGWQKDPRIQEIREKRNQKKDYAIIFDCLEKQVASDSSEINNQTNVLIGNLNSATASKWKKMPPNLKHIGGHAYFGDSQIKELGQLESIGRSAYFGYSQIKELGQLKSIGGNTFFRDSQIKELGQLESIGGSVFIDKNTKIDFSKIKHGKIIIE